MKKSMRSRLLIIVATIAIVLVISTGWATRVAFQQGFLDYLSQQTIDRMQAVTPSLLEVYVETGNWEALQGDTLLWRDLIDDGRPPARGAGQGQGQGQGNQPRTDNADPMAFRPPANSQVVSTINVPNWSLVNADFSWIGGRRLNDREVDMLVVPVLLEGETIGNLLAPKPSGFEEGLDQAFVQGQLRISIWIAVFSLAFVLPLAIYIAMRLLSPIKGLTLAVNNLTAGDYGAQITVQRDDELGQLARDFNKLSQTLEANKTSQQRWISDISHELRTPISILEGEIAAILDGLRKADTKEMESLAAEIRRLGRLVNDLHQLSKSDIGDLSYRMEPIDIKSVIEHTANAFEKRFSEVGLSYKSAYKAKETPILGDESRLIQLFSNLFENSCRYTDAPGQISLSVEVVNDSVVVSISDSSPGVKDTDLPLLFERLYRVEKSRNRASGGSGLGLAICRNIATAHSAELSATQSNLGGVQMTLTIPLHRLTEGKNL